MRCISQSKCIIWPLSDIMKLPGVYVCILSDCECDSYRCRLTEMLTISDSDWHSIDAFFQSSEITKFQTKQSIISPRFTRPLLFLDN